MKPDMSASNWPRTSSRTVSWRRPRWSAKLSSSARKNSFTALRNEFLLVNTAICPPQQDRADRLKEEIRHPKNQIGKPVRTRFERLAQNEKAVVDEHQNQRHRNA